MLKHLQIRQGITPLTNLVSPIPKGEKLITVTKSVFRKGEKTNTAVSFHWSETEPRNEHIEDIASHLDEYDEFRQNRKVARESYSAFLSPKALLSEQIHASHERLIPYGLAKKEDFFSRVPDWVESATTDELDVHINDGWIDIDTALKRLTKLNEMNSASKS